MGSTLTQATAISLYIFHSSLFVNHHPIRRYTAGDADSVVK